MTVTNSIAESPIRALTESPLKALNYFFSGPPLATEVKTSQFVKAWCGVLPYRPPWLIGLWLTDGGNTEPPPTTILEQLQYYFKRYSSVEVDYQAIGQNTVNYHGVGQLDQYGNETTSGFPNEVHYELVNGWSQPPILSLVGTRNPTVAFPLYNTNTGLNTFPIIFVPGEGNVSVLDGNQTSSYSIASTPNPDFFVQNWVNESYTERISGPQIDFDAQYTAARATCMALPFAETFELPAFAKQLSQAGYIYGPDKPWSGAVIDLILGNGAGTGLNPYTWVYNGGAVSGWFIGDYDIQNTVYLFRSKVKNTGSRTRNYIIVHERATVQNSAIYGSSSRSIYYGYVGAGTLAPGAFISDAIGYPTKLDFPTQSPVTLETRNGSPVWYAINHVIFDMTWAEYLASLGPGHVEGWHDYYVQP